MTRVRKWWLVTIVFGLVVFCLINMYIGKQRHQVMDEISRGTVETVYTAQKIVEDTSSRQKQSETCTREVLSNASIAIILAYMRSGSSFTGASLQAVPKTFYIFEPVHSISAEFWKSNDSFVHILYPNGTTIYHKREDQHRLMVQELVNYLTCNLGNVSVASLSDRFHQDKTNLMKKLRYCTLKFVKKNGVESRKSLYSYNNWTRCLEETRQDCLNAPMRVLKLIRNSMSDMKKLMPQFPNMKILYLNRDPRGMYHSRIRYNLIENGLGFNKSVVRFCARWIRDIEVTRGIANEFQGRIRRVRYEDIAQDPSKMFKDISEYFGVDFEPGIKNFLVKMMNVTADGKTYNLDRVNPYQTAIKWRNTMNYTEAAYISKICAAGMREMNYLHFSNEQDMRNLYIPFRGPLSNLDGNSIT